ncbi:hypothetical protein AAHB47_30520 [Bacillus wiedmannii]
MFSIGMQPIFDYIFALKLYENGHNHDDMKIPKQFMEQNGAIMMLAILLMEEHSYSVIRKYWHKTILFKFGKIVFDMFYVS